jgi:hypothetical protein
MGGTPVVEVLKGKVGEKCTRHHEEIELQLFRQLVKEADGTEDLSVLDTPEGEASIP